MQQKTSPRKTRAASAAPDAQQGALRRVAGLDYGVLDGLLGYALRRAQNALYLDFQRAVPDAELSPQRFAALVLVLRNPGLRQGVLSEAMGLHRSGGLRLTDWLCERGWAERRDDPADGRSWTLHGTAAGRRALRSLSAAVQTHDARLLAALGAAGAGLLGGLDQLALVASMES